MTRVYKRKKDATPLVPNSVEHFLYPNESRGLSQQDIVIAVPKKKKIKPKYDHSHYKRYPLDAKIDAVASWTALGNLRTVSELLGIHYDTLLSWKKERWWADLAKQIREEKTEELDSRLSGIIEESLKVLEDRLQTGDVLINAKTGQIIRTPVTAASATKILSTVFDKRQLVRNEPTTISKTETTDDRLHRLAEDFARFTAARTIEGTAKTNTEETTNTSNSIAQE